MADGEQLEGQRYDENRNLVIRFHQTMKDVTSASSDLEDTLKDITPVDRDASLVREYVVPTAAIAAYAKSFISYDSFELPDQLISLSAVFSKNGGNGGFTESGAYSSSGSSANINISSSGRGQGSGAIIPGLIVNRKQTWARDVPVGNYFYYTNAATTVATAITALAAKFTVTATAWPVFKPESHTIVLTGQQLSVNLEVRAHAESSLSTANTTYGVQTGIGGNQEVGVSLREEVIPPTIHAALTIANATTGNEQTFTVAAEAQASISNPALNSHPVQGPGTFTVTGTVSPTFLPATQNQATIPTSGIRIRRIDVQPNAFYGYDLVHVTTFDFANLA